MLKTLWSTNRIPSNCQSSQVIRNNQRQCQNLIRKIGVDYIKLGCWIFDQEVNGKKRLAISGANFARAYIVQFGTCKFPHNFSGCQDLAKQQVCHYSLPISLVLWTCPISSNPKKQRNSFDIRFQLKLQKVPFISDDLELQSEGKDKYKCGCVERVVNDNLNVIKCTFLSKV